MKYLLLFLLIPGIILAKELDSKAKISAVTVFKDRAYVTRSMKSEIPEGNHSIIFYPVTSQLQKDSLKVLTKNRGIKILGVRHENVFFKESSSQEVVELRSEKQKIDNQLQSLRTEVSNIIREHNELRNISNHYQESFPLNLNRNKWSAGQFNSFIRFLDSRNNKMQGTWKKLFKRYLNLWDERQFIMGKLTELSGSDRTDNLKVIVDVQANSASPGIELQYLVYGASWNPHYDIRISKRNSKARIFQSGLVSQYTGEDWDNVKIVLSNKQSELKPKVPSISSYSLTYRKVEEVKTNVVATNQANVKLAGADISSDERESLNKNFIVKGRQTVKSNRPQVKIQLANAEADYREWLELVPGQYPKVYKKGEVSNPFSYALGPGDMNIFYNGTFISKFFKDFTPKGKKFYVNAGIDYSITVNRSVRNKTAEEGLINSKKIYSKKFVTSLHNYSGENKIIKLYEQVPISELEAVEVSFDSTNKNHKEDKEMPSWIYWNLDLPSNQLTTHEMDLSVKAPEDFGVKNFFNSMR